jgi:hypothetical protein
MKRTSENSVHAQASRQKKLVTIAKLKKGQLDYKGHGKKWWEE